jgi:hypothetical protein
MNDQIIKELVHACGMELETVQNYIAASVNLDGVRSEVIKKALAADVPTELMRRHRLRDAGHGDRNSRRGRRESPRIHGFPQGIRATKLID